MSWSWNCPVCGETIYRWFSIPVASTKEEQDEINEEIRKALDRIVENHLKTHSSASKARNTNDK